MELGWEPGVCGVDMGLRTHRAQRSPRNDNGASPEQGVEVRRPRLRVWDSLLVPTKHTHLALTAWSVAPPGIGNFLLGPLLGSVSQAYDPWQGGRHRNAEAPRCLHFSDALPCLLTGGQGRGTPGWGGGDQGRKLTRVLSFLDECEEVEHQCQRTVQQLEAVLGEPLQSYF